jgi:DNA mismatch endonuclease (patch repair protein)
VDSLTKEQRSKLMSRIRSRGNKRTELVFAAILRAYKITGWRRHQSLPGTPDFIFRCERVAVFVDGCFWHGCSSHCRMPKSRKDYWNPKIERNKQRDRDIRKILLSLGWRVCRVWEHSLKKPEHVVSRLHAMLGNGSRNGLNPVRHASAKNKCRTI